MGDPSPLCLPRMAKGHSCVKIDQAFPLRFVLLHTASSVYIANTLASGPSPGDNRIYLYIWFSNTTHKCSLLSCPTYYQSLCHTHTQTHTDARTHTHTDMHTHTHTQTCTHTHTHAHTHTHTHTHTHSHTHSCRMHDCTCIVANVQYSLMVIAQWLLGLVWVSPILVGLHCMSVCLSVCLRQV